MEVQGHDGIQKLMAAEQEAQRIVSQARQQKNERLKQAKSEAAGEISRFRADREANFQKKIAQGGDSSSVQFANMVRDSDRAVEAIKRDTAALKSQVTSTLISAVLQVKS